MTVLAANYKKTHTNVHREQKINLKENEFKTIKKQ